MATQAPAIVQNNAGLLGVLERPESLRVGSEARIAVRLVDGRVVLVPVDLMSQQPDGSFFLDLDAAAVGALETESGTGAAAAVGAAAGGRSAARAGDAVVVPVVAEEAEVAKREVEVGRVRVRKSVEVADRVVADSLAREDVEVERVPVNRVVDGPVGNREEGETLVVPVYKEVLVVEKRLMLVEEIRITRRRTEQPFSRTVPLRTEVVEVERSSAANDADM
jgi:uncharacterized protein (TIGR02271 family)